MQSILTRTLSIPSPGFYSLSGRIKGRYWLTQTTSGQFSTIDIRDTRNAPYSLGSINLTDGNPKWGHFKNDFLSRSDLQALTIS